MTELKELMQTLNEMEEILQNAVRKSGTQIDYPRAKVALEFAKSELLKSISAKKPKTD